MKEDADTIDHFKDIPEEEYHGEGTVTENPPAVEESDEEPDEDSYEDAISSDSQEQEEQ